MTFSYSFRLALQSILREKWIYLLSVMTIAAGLLFTTITVLFVYNIDSATKKLPEKFSVMLYLSDTISQQERDNIITTVQKDRAVDKAVFIPKDQALKELKSTLKDSAFILEGLGENPLPDSLEIKFKSDAVGPDAVQRLANSVKDMKGIQEIEYGENFLSAVHSLRTGMKTIGMTIFIIMSVGMLFVCYSTVKILFYRKDREIETYKLLGATRSFIRTPFLLEGAVIGFAGGLLSLIGIQTLYYVLVFRLSATFPLLKLIAFPIDLSLAIPLSGLLIGITGAAIAIGRIRY
ncbi:MAG: efflux transporter permease [Nitrospirae bacterium]|nr:efflux transporter permease [Nitrospirota bacterium]